MKKDLEPTWKKSSIKREYFDKIRNKNQKVGEAYFNAFKDHIARETEFDKVLFIEFIEFMNKSSLIDARAKDLILNFVKPM